jgi:hypothetical protein
MNLMGQWKFFLKATLVQPSTFRKQLTVLEKDAVHKNFRLRKLVCCVAGMGMRGRSKIKTSYIVR